MPGQPEPVVSADPTVAVVILPAVLTVAWGVLAFGAVHPWAYWPLAWGSLMTGALWLREGSGLPGAVSSRLGAALLVLVTAIALQLVPLPPGLLRVVSPASAEFTASYNALPGATISDATGGALSAPGADAFRPLSLRPHSTVTALALTIAFGAMLLGAASGLRQRDARGLAAGLLVIGSAVAFLSLAQRATYDGEIYGFWESRFSRHAYGPFVNRNHFSGWMLMAISVGLGYLLAISSRGMLGLSGWRSRILWLSSPDATRIVLVALALAVMALSVALTGSRSGIGGLAIALVAMTACALRREVDRSRRAAVLAAVVCVALAIAAWAGLDSLTRFAKHGVASAGRAELWADAAHVARRFPVAGTGLNTYPSVTPFFKTRSLEASSDEAHNEYLQLAAEGGLLVGIPVLALAVVFCGEVRRRFAAAPSLTSYWLRVGGVVGLFVMALQESVEFSLQLPGNAALFTALCAIAVHQHEERAQLEAS